MQRVALGRAMVMNPKVFLMDEPLSNLDTALKGQMRKELMKLHKRLETTFIYVTHDQTEAMTMGTRICVINEGRIQQVDTPNKIYNKPENTFVAEFIGTPKINLLKADILKDPTVKGELVFDFGAFDMRAKEELLAFNLEASMGGVTVGFRPQDVIVRNLEHPKSDFFEIDLIEILGSDCILHLKRDKLGITALVSNDIAYKIGGAVAIELKPEKCHFFDLETGIRL